MSLCNEEQCKFYTECHDVHNGVWDDYSFCTKHKKIIDCENEICSEYIKAKKCFNCKHSRKIIYETGTIDCIDYHCKLQDKKLMYSDCNWLDDHYADYPECNINKWESE